MKRPYDLILRFWPIAAVLAGMFLLHSGWAAIFLYHLGILSAVGITKTSWKEALSGFQWKPAVLLFIIGGCAAPAIVLLLPVLLGLSPEATGMALRSGLEKTGLVGIQFWLFAAYLCLWHPAAEEIGWRELLFVDSRRLHLRDFEFASYHLLVMHYFFPFAWAFFAVCLVGLASMSWVWRLLKMKYQGLAVPAWSHAGADLGVMLGVWWLLHQLKS